ncbi:hypothetical protein AX774_g68 [Zancudomyces culisetae]|uniref:CCHC-type domain-containing protein n=1 Tax=Zancudomyces culisetae TaxID=1213189 RepID=A0A1R1PZI7_ZANCU|nr:hypothetical protein AX774_g68 [Zancudomyces culisetae]|eukprot:OMH86381.1 hypothetical protein AX774_g68 [Zancudomyces culisetae]
MDNQQSLSRATNYTKDNRDQVLTRNESGNSSSDINYQEMLHKMEEWSVNILTKVDEAVERRLRLVQYGNKSRPRYPPRQVRCFNCQKIGHKRHECPQNMESNHSRIENQTRDVNLLETELQLKQENEVLAVQRRKCPDISNKSYIRKVSTSKENTMDQKKQITKVPTYLKMAERVKPFSLSEQLATFYPQISLPQLLEALPKLSNELTMLNKKVKKSEINEIRMETPKQSNSKIQVVIFDMETTAIVDTGAVCSVATPDLVESWGLIPEPDDNQIIVTADDKRHGSRGKISGVPLVIGGLEFPTDMVIMDRMDNTLILGTDFLQKFKVIIDLREKTIKLPIANAELIIPIYTNSLKSNSDQDYTEIYLIAKQDTIDAVEEDSYVDKRFDKLKESYSELFVENLEELTQTNVVEHTIELTDNKAIKQKPYRISYHLQQMVRDELKLMEEHEKYGIQ